MIIGSGLIANGFSDYLNRDNVIIFASGVSNSNMKATELSFQFTIPIQEVSPTLMKKIRREGTSIFLQPICRRLLWCSHRRHFGLFRQFVAFCKITRRTRRHDIFPSCSSASTTRNNVVECQDFSCEPMTTVLA